MVKQGVHGVNTGLQFCRQSAVTALAAICVLPLGHSACVQDAWVLLEHDGDDAGEAVSLQEAQANEVLPAEPAAQRKGRKPGRPAGSQNKRART